MTTIIFAAGPATRWQSARAVKWGGVRGISDPPEFKQMMLVGEEPNILRTTRLLREAGESNIIIWTTASLKVTLADAKEYIHSVDDEGERPLLSRVIESKLYWWPSQTRVNFLHGDVIFSRDTISKILDYEGNFGSFGRFGPNHFTGKRAPELFAVVAREIATYTSLLDACESLSRNDGLTSAIINKLWDLRAEMRDRGFSFEGADNEIFDWTDDVDSGEEYINFYPKLVNYALREEDLHQEKLRLGHR